MLPFTPIFMYEKKSERFRHKKLMLNVNISHILEEACLATLAASEAKVALLNSELIVIILPKPAPGSSTTLLTLMMGLFNLTLKN